MERVKKILDAIERAKSVDTKEKAFTKRKLMFNFALGGL